AARGAAAAAGDLLHVVDTRDVQHLAQEAAGEVGPPRGEQAGGALPGGRRLVAVEDLAVAVPVDPHGQERLQAEALRDHGGEGAGQLPHGVTRWLPGDDRLRATLTSSSSQSAVIASPGLVTITCQLVPSWSV